jgi:hypothetical protein
MKAVHFEHMRKEVRRETGQIIDERKHELHPIPHHQSALGENQVKWIALINFIIMVVFVSIEADSIHFARGLLLSPAARSASCLHHRNTGLVLNTFRSVWV